MGVRCGRGFGVGVRVGGAVGVLVAPGLLTPDPAVAVAVNSGADVGCGGRLTGVSVGGADVGRGGSG